MLVIADISRALRQEEQSAWQRLVRVLGHELNNSLAPIKSIAGSLETMLNRNPDRHAWPDDMPEDLQRGLSIISARAESLTRFMSAYAKLAKLPPPVLQPLEIGPWMQRLAALETRQTIAVLPGPEITPASRPRPARTIAHQPLAQCRRRRARNRRRRARALELHRCAARNRYRGRRARLVEYSQLVRAVLYYEAARLRHRPRAQSPNCRKPRRYAHPRKPPRRARLRRPIAFAVIEKGSTASVSDLSLGNVSNDSRARAIKAHIRSRYRRKLRLDRTQPKR